MSRGNFYWYNRQYLFTWKDIHYAGMTFRDIITLTRDNPEIFPGNFERAVKRGGTRKRRVGSIIATRASRRGQ